MVQTIVVAVIVVSALWVYLDATKNRIGKVAGRGTFNMSAGGWAVVTLLLWIIGFPAYLLKRGALIEQAQANPVEAKNRGGKAAFLGLVGVGWISVSLLSVLDGGDLPSCDAVEVVALAEKSLRDSPAIQGLGVQIVGISVPGEKSYDPSKGQRVCRGMLKSSAGEEPVHYSVEWHDRPKGMIWVQMLAE